VFAAWARDLAEDVELLALQLPGREVRLREPPWTDCGALAETIGAALNDDTPLVLYGHSFGALLAFEVAHRLLRRGVRPLGLVVSGRRAPRCSDPESPIGGLSDTGFLEAVASRYGGLPEAVRRNSELVELILPALRADMGITEGYRYAHTEVLDIPILAFGGEADSRVSRSALSRWQEETTGSFALRMLPGGHFFHQERRREILGEQERWLRQHARS
jgi:medium-chain acyl-[acyl-carrier-protein] hydrolase